MPDQSVREIQLNGKQLVFMFMTATVAAVVIFLCGVMVGRGVNTTRLAAAAAVATEATVDPTLTPESSATPSPDAASSGDPISAQEGLKDLTYARRLEAPEPPPEPAIESIPSPTPAPAIAESRVDRPVAAPTATKAGLSEPTGTGFVVQVASLRSRDEADAIARRLSSKGYTSFVTTPGASGPKVFRVRVGKFTDRSEAETVARRLEKEEQFKPWITR